MNARQSNPPQSYWDEGGYASADSAEECAGATRLRVGLHMDEKSSDPQNLLQKSEQKTRMKESC